MASPRSSHHPILESGTRTLPWHLISTSSRSSCQSSWCLSHPYQCRETVSCLPLPLRHTTLSHSLHGLHWHLGGRLLRHSHWRCLLCGLLIHHLLFFQPLFIAAYDFALTVDLDLGRDVPRALRLLMFPTREFFIPERSILLVRRHFCLPSSSFVRDGRLSQQSRHLETNRIPLPLVLA